MTTPYRILVTGSRDWDDADAVVFHLEAATLDALGREVIIVHGACPSGADSIADQFARYYDLAVEAHPANWDRHGRSAGFRRNAEMVALGADVCLAFIKDGSRGATHCASAAEKAGIPVQRYDYWAHSEEAVWSPGMGSA
jgi:hypothetical protein